MTGYTLCSDCGASYEVMTPHTCGVESSSLGAASLKTPLRISRHAAQRYRERIRPVSLREATREIKRLVEVAEWSDRLPNWAKVAQQNDGCLVIGDLALVVQNGVIVTCLSKGWVPPGQLRRRRNWKKQRKARGIRRRGL